MIRGQGFFLCEEIMKHSRDECQTFGDGPSGGTLEGGQQF